MNDDRDHLQEDLDARERAALNTIGERLARERPLPRAAFRAALRSQLTGRRRGTAGAWISGGRWRVLAGVYSGLGVLMLGVAAIGLLGAGPFGA